VSGAIDQKKLWITSAVVFVVLYALEFLVHAVLLKPIYDKPHYVNLWNPEAVMMGRMPAMAGAYAVAAVLFVILYAEGYEASRPAIGQGWRSGFLVGTLMSTFHSLVDFAVYPVSWKLAAAWIAAGIAIFTIVGIVTSMLYKPKA
jgi:hypothetical protein